LWPILPGLTLVALAGCGSTSGLTPSADSVLSVEPNDTFDQATVVDAERSAKVRAGGLLTLEGTISTPSDADVFALGPLSVGDRIVIDARTPDSPLDITVGLFDADHRVVHVNDDGGITGRSLDAYVDFTVRHSAATYHLVVARSDADTTRNTGAYRVQIQVSSGQATLPVHGQTLLLDFDGGLVDSPTLGRVTIAPFSADTISRRYSGDTETLKTLIRQTVEQNFERFNVVVVTSDDPLSSLLTDASTIHVGGFNDETFGIAEQVDNYNEDYCDDGIVYAESFSPRVFSFPPSTQQLAVAIGNIVAHEGGHLLGLNHVDDPLAIMDGVSPADTFLADQEFKLAPLSLQIMPIGWQDAPMLLLETVGPSSVLP
jgi:hypothetical protein